MKFIERYPESNHHEEFNTENGKKILRCCGDVPCSICGEYSYFADDILLVSICSDECQKKLWKKFDETTKKQL